MQKINLLGMNLTDYTLKESQGIVERYLHGGTCNAIVYLSAEMLVGAGVSQAQKEWLEDIDLIAWSDAEILKKSGVTSKSRIHDVENREFLKDFLKCIAKGGHTVYLLADSENELEKLRQDLFMMRGDLRIVGEIATERGLENYDGIVNALNMATPKVIISRMAYDQLEHMMTKCRKYLNAEIWFALNKRMALNNTRKSLSRKIIDKWYHLLLRKHVEEYEQNKKI